MIRPQRDNFHSDHILLSTCVVAVGTGVLVPWRNGKLLTGGGSWNKKLGIRTKLIQTEKLSVVPVLPLQAQTACSEEGLTMIVGWRKMGLLISF